MNNQPTNTSVSQPQDETTDGMLPAVQVPVGPPLPVGDNTTQTVPAGQTMPDSHALVPMPEDASDSDLIEKEWVLKAKQIVEHTSEDPFRQAEELSKMRTEYLKKRYNKDIGQA